jgi:hypothetical protein
VWLICFTEASLFFKIIPEHICVFVSSSREFKTAVPVDSGPCIHNGSRTVITTSWLLQNLGAPTPCLEFPRHAYSSHAMPRAPTPCLELPRHAYSSHAMPRAPTPCLQLPRHAYSSHAMPRAQTKYLLHVTRLQVLPPNEKNKTTPRTVLPTLWLPWVRDDFGLGVLRTGCWEELLDLRGMKDTRIWRPDNDNNMLS